MKKITALFISSILASCANLPAEYNVVKKTDRKTTMTLNQLRIGITEEKLGACCDRGMNLNFLLGSISSRLQ